MNKFSYLYHLLIDTSQKNVELKKQVREQQIYYNTVQVKFKILNIK